MCFAKSSPSTPAVEPQEPVVQHQANASITKNSQNNKKSGFSENVKTSIFGLEEQANTSRKTLLGE